MTSLDLRIKRPIKSHLEAEWKEWTSEAKVISDMVRSSGLQDKTIAIEIGIDNALLSKSQTGQARLSEHHIDALMDACGDEAWLHFWLLKRGYDPRSLRRIESDVERENRLLKEEIEEMKKVREVEMKLLKEIKAL